MADWKRATKRQPCLVCGKPDWCCWTNDVVMCMRVESERRVETGCGVGFFHPRTDSIGPTFLSGTTAKKSKPRPTDDELDDKWRVKCRAWQSGTRMRSSDCVVELAAKLCVSYASLILIEAGWDGQAWTFPERSDTGHYLGVTRRFPDGRKVCATGSRRGLVYPSSICDPIMPNLDNFADTILLVEGASDVAACWTMGILAVGRPSNTGGVEYLRKLIPHFNRDTKVIVLGECDRRRPPRPISCKVDGCLGCPECWPGLFGAQYVAKSLGLEWRMPPHGAKDVRSWMIFWMGLRELNVGPGCLELGKELLRNLE